MENSCIIIMNNFILAGNFQTMLFAGHLKRGLLAFVRCSSWRQKEPFSKKREVTFLTQIVLSNVELMIIKRKKDNINYNKNNKNNTWKKAQSLFLSRSSFRKSVSAHIWLHGFLAASPRAMLLLSLVDRIVTSAT